MLVSRNAAADDGAQRYCACDTRVKKAGIAHGVVSFSWDGQRRRDCNTALRCIYCLRLGAESRGWHRGSYLFCVGRRLFGTRSVLVDAGRGVAQCISRISSGMPAGFVRSVADRGRGGAQRRTQLIDKIFKSTLVIDTNFGHIREDVSLARTLRQRRAFAVQAHLRWRDARKD